jgi:HAD superfamily phosphatase (TIGR01668 family)
MLINSRSNSDRKRFWRWFQPDYIAERVATIDFRQLHTKGVAAIFIDLDGTVVARGTYEVDPGITKALRNQPLPVYIATNRPESRDLKNLRQLLHAQGVIHPHGVFGKPTRRYFSTALKEHGLQPSQVVMIGDRYLQDMCGANAAGLQTVLVHKLDPPTNWFDRLLSSLERRHTVRLSSHYQPIQK